MSRLLAKFLMQLRFVRKSWSSLFRSPSFFTAYQNFHCNDKTNTTHLLLQCKEHFFSSQLDQQGNPTLVDVVLTAWYVLHMMFTPAAPESLSNFALCGETRLGLKISTLSTDSWRTLEVDVDDLPFARLTLLALLHQKCVCINGDMYWRQTYSTTHASALSVTEERTTI